MWRSQCTLCTVYSVYMWHVCRDWTFFSLDIIILTARRKEANNYVTQKTISPPRLGHFLVLPLLPLSPSLCSSAPSPHKCLLDRVENCPSANCPPVYFQWFLRVAKMHWSLSLLFKATWRFLSSQSLLGRGGRKEGKNRREREIEKDGGRGEEREREREIREMWGGRL